MLQKIKNLRHSLVFKIILSVGIILLLIISAWASINIHHYKNKIMDAIVKNCDQLSKTIQLGTRYSMMFNARDDINQIVTNIGKLEGLEHIRIYNKSGQIKFSNLPSEVGLTTGIKAEACDICHRADPPLEFLELSKRKRVFTSPENQRLIGIISPILNEPGCATSECHAHPEGKKILGALDVVISLDETDKEMASYEKWLIIPTIFVFILTSTFIFFVLSKLLIAPIKRLIQGTRKIAKGEYNALADFRQDDEIGHLAGEINKMGLEIGNKQRELNRQKDEYKNLFELVPCIISVQDRDYRLINYNQEFSRLFDPKPDDFCYSAYKGRKEKCQYCPVEQTFQDGKSHYSEETGINKDGTISHWIVKTAPMKNAAGEIIGAMEINLDISHAKQLEDRLKQSEKKYYAIFNNIPNPVFLLDQDTLEILDCNESVTTVYGFGKAEVLKKSFLSFFAEEEKMKVVTDIKNRTEINRAKHISKTGEILFVNMLISPSDFSDRKVLLVTTSDVTKHLETEAQLIQAGKMATLGEMATGVAHELNQPLSVIKTASSFFIKKIRKKELIKEDILLTMAEEMDAHVDRAANIINHLRQFGRKPDIALEKIQINNTIKNAFEMFWRQLQLREIAVSWDLEKNLPLIMAEQGRLEQVFINFILNARDAIEEKWKSGKADIGEEKKISLKTYSKHNKVFIELSDTGIGIPKEILHKIFEPFFTTKKVGEGTGIGLSISYNIIKDFQGDIHVHSRKDKGTTFTITFPISDII
ncbi:MAG: ATP-binding protein [Desulfobacterales bacterium]